MKSIMEQASSIVKAIEKAWISADKPKEFTVKIFENEEKNFFGMTTKPAKIGIFFSEKGGSTQEKIAQKVKPEIREQRTENFNQTPRAPHVAKQTPKNNPVKAEKLKTEIQQQQPQQAKTQQQKQPQPQRPSATWNDAMTNSATAWINKTLSLAGIPAVDFTCEVAGKILKITLAKPLLENQLTEKNLFRSIAHLIMASLRNQYKQEIKDLKIVLIRPE